MRLIIETECGKSVLYFKDWPEAREYLEKLEKKGIKEWFTIEP